MVIGKGMVLVAAVIAFGIASIDDLSTGSSPASIFSFTDAQAATTDEAVVQSGALRRRAAENLRVLMQRQAEGAARTGPTGLAALVVNSDGVAFGAAQSAQ